MSVICSTGWYPAPFEVPGWQLSDCQELLLGSENLNVLCKLSVLRICQEKALEIMVTNLQDVYVQRQQQTEVQAKWSHRMRDVNLSVNKSKIDFLYDCFADEMGSAYRTEVSAYAPCDQFPSLQLKLKIHFLGPQSSVLFTSCWSFDLIKVPYEEFPLRNVLIAPLLVHIVRSGSVVSLRELSKETGSRRSNPEVGETDSLPAMDSNPSNQRSVETEDSVLSEVATDEDSDVRKRKEEIARLHQRPTKKTRQRTGIL